MRPMPGCPIHRALVSRDGWEPRIFPSLFIAPPIRHPERSPSRTCDGRSRRTPRIPTPPRPPEPFCLEVKDRAGCRVPGAPYLAALSPDVGAPQPASNLLDPNSPTPPGCPTHDSPLVMSGSSKPHALFRSRSTPAQSPPVRSHR